MAISRAALAIWCGRRKIESVLSLNSPNGHHPIRRSYHLAPGFACPSSFLEHSHLGDRTSLIVFLAVPNPNELTLR
jgi:hypothetical protein